MAMTKSEEIWPSLPLAEWRDTCATLQLWTQIIGKITSIDQMIKTA